MTLSPIWQPQTDYMLYELLRNLIGGGKNGSAYGEFSKKKKKKKKGIVN
jgi:hypothetical protein